MKFLRNNKRISFLYDGKSIWEHGLKTNIKQNENKIVCEYLTADGLKVTNIAIKYSDFDAYEWVTWFENTGEKPTGIISQLYDCDTDIPFGHDDFLPRTAYIPEAEKDMKIYSPNGSDWVEEEFCCNIDVFKENRYNNHIYPGEVKSYKNTGGRSSEGKAPYFNIHRQGRGVVFAIGWTGQWNCSIKRSEDSVNIKTKIEDTNFRLLPHEKIRTSSFVIMNYKGDFICSQNKWRRFVKKYFSPIGTGKRDSHLPLCAGIWGGMGSACMLHRIEKIKKNRLPFEYIWIDAGWYGTSKKESPDTFEGDWSDYTGDWRVNESHHPNGLLDVTKALHNAGMKLILWFEPERVIYSTPIVGEHPEYFIGSPYENDRNLLLNLGNENAWQYCFDMLSDKIEKLGVDCYRQDFNFSPLAYWRRNDSYDRKGITEIKHIMGLYRLWDALLKKFPKLLIDNCASGGRRLDIEMQKRSVPLWRSDFQCPANYPIEATQSHNINFGLWMPYSGTGSGRDWSDSYRIRSAYAGGLTTNYSFSAKNEYCADETQIEAIRKICEEYRRVREYFYSDIYPLTETVAGDDAWVAVQYNRPEKKDGMVQIFKRSKSPFTNAEFKLSGINEDKMYAFLDADNNSELIISGKKLMNLKIEIQEKRVAKIYFYREVETVEIS